MIMNRIIILCIIATLIAACSTTKKSASSTTSLNSSSSSAPVPSSDNYLFSKPANGTHAPVNADLAALQIRFKDITMDKLREGYSIYTDGACINCHEAKNVYEFEEGQWKDILDDMADKARLTESEKDAVSKYILSIKATQPK